MYFKKISHNSVAAIGLMLMLILSWRGVTSAMTLELRHLEPTQAAVIYFSVESQTRLFIDAVVGMDRSSKSPLSAAWITDNQGQFVWKIELSECEIDRGREFVSCKSDIIMEPGCYMVNYYVSPLPVKQKKKSWLWRLFHKSETYESIKEWGIRLESDSIEQIRSDEFYASKNIVVDMSHMTDNQYRTKGITILNKAPMEIHAVGEGDLQKRIMFDYGWILDASTRARIWKMNAYNSVHAGGADKNLFARDFLTLQPGNYIISFITDESHSYESWNDTPPYDPASWGIRMRYLGDQPLDSVVTPFQEYRSEPIVDLTRVVNNRCLMDGFSLKKGTRLYIRACGEYLISRKKFVDHGWIMNASTREIVWSMTYENTYHAGGHAKNRLFDDFIELDAGNYLVFYLTDAEHAYGSWNERPPGLDDWWGIAVYAPNVEPKTVIVPYDEASDSSVLAQLIQVGAKSKRTKKISVTDTSLIRIYAIGEGDKYQMYDYGWIEDEAGNIVWMMNYKSTFEAGGAQKNRLTNDLIQLLPGTYRVYFESDDSHSYGDWNDMPPDDQIHWGITVIKLND